MEQRYDGRVTDENTPDVEAVFIAANVAEAELVEKLFEAEGIEYQVTPEPFVKSIAGVCYTGLLFEVLAGQAPYCRKLLVDAHLARGVVES